MDSIDQLNSNLFTFVRLCDQHVRHYKICHVFFPGRNLPNLKTRECLTDASFFSSNHTAQKGRRWVNFGVLKQMKSYEIPWGLKVSCCHLLWKKCGLINLVPLKDGWEVSWLATLGHDWDQLRPVWSYFMWIFMGNHCHPSIYIVCKHKTLGSEMTLMAMLVRVDGSILAKFGDLGWYWMMSKWLSWFGEMNTHCSKRHWYRIRIKYPWCIFKNKMTKAVLLILKNSWLPLFCPWLQYTTEDVINTLCRERAWVVTWSPAEDCLVLLADWTATLQETNISPQKWHFWRWFSFSQGGICWSPGG